MADPALRATAAEVLLLALKDRTVNPYALGALATIPEAGIQAVIDLYQDEEKPQATDATGRPAVPAIGDPKTREAAIERFVRIVAARDELSGFGCVALGKIGQPAFEPLLSVMQDADLRVRRFAALALQNVFPAVPPDTRSRALEGLTRLAEEERMVGDGKNYAQYSLEVLRGAAPVPSTQNKLQPGR